MPRPFVSGSIPAVVSYETLARLFFEIHDPTQVDRQGPDVGDQYRSEIFYTTPEQKRTALELIGRLRAKGYDVVTKLSPATTFWKAEDYHQNYSRPQRRVALLPPVCQALLGPGHRFRADSVRIR